MEGAWHGIAALRILPQASPMRGITPSLALPLSIAALVLQA